MRISDWSSDVCSSDLCLGDQRVGRQAAAVVAHDDLDLVARLARRHRQVRRHALARRDALIERLDAMVDGVADDVDQRIADILHHLAIQLDRSEEHTSELQSLMRISYAVFRLKKK